MRNNHEPPRPLWLTSCNQCCPPPPPPSPRVPFLPTPLSATSSENGGSRPEPRFSPRLARARSTPPRFGPRSERTRRKGAAAKGRREARPARTVLAAGVAGPQLHGPCAHGPTRGLLAPRVPRCRSRWPRLVPRVAGVPEAAGVGPRGGENDAPQRGTVLGEESPRVLGNSLGRGPSARAAGRGAHALPGCGGCSAPGEGVTASRPRREARGAGPRAPPLRDAGTAPGCVPSVREMMDPQTVGEGEFFPAEEEVGKVEVGRGTAARWSPPRSGGGPRPWVSPFLSAFLASSFPASLPGSFIQHRSDLCWALAHNRRTVSRCPINGPYLSVE